MAESTNAAATSPSSRTQELYERAKAIIPGGTQLLSKRPELYAPGRWPAYYREASGCEVVDLDGRRYLDMSIMGVGACLLGYNDPDVTAAVQQRVQSGSFCTLNSPDEVDLAELLLQLHPWAGGVRYARTGGEAMAVAVRIARAATKRSVVAFCGYHGWHDWYLAANWANRDGDSLKEHLLPGLPPSGVPQELAGTALPFRYNQLDELRDIANRHPDTLAAVVMEPTRSMPPEPGFLEGVREICNSTGAALVFDEITAGWRFVLGGAHLNYGVEPDIAAFGKSLGNGYAMTAVIGRSETMYAAQESFISSTYWTEGIGPAAALATIRKMQQVDVPAHVAAIGTKFREGLQQLAAEHGVPLQLSGYPAITVVGFDHADSLALQTLMTVRMLERDILAGVGFYATLTHTPQHVERYLEAAAQIMPELAEAADKGDAADRIGGAVRHSGLTRLN